MAVFIPSVKIETNNNCNDLKITDTSVFTVETPKTLYTSRIITITKTDSTTQTINFPINGTSVDEITIANYLVGLDYYISIKIVYSAISLPAQYVVTLDRNYISTCNAEVARSKFINKVDCGCDCVNKCDISNLAKLDTTIENSIRASTLNLGIMAQTFLDSSLDLIKVLESDCGC